MKRLNDKSLHSRGLFLLVKEQVLIKLIQSHLTIDYIASQMRSSSHFLTPTARSQLTVLCLWLSFN